MVQQKISREPFIRFLCINTMASLCPLNPFLQMAKSPEMPSHAFEIAAFTLAAALAGARIFRCAGLMSSGETYSGEQVVIAKEIVEYIKNLIKSREFSDERLMVDEIACCWRRAEFYRKEKHHGLLQERLLAA